MYVGKKIVSILLLLVSLAVLGAAAVFTLAFYGILNFDPDIIRLCGTLVMCGGGAVFLLGIISIILSAVGGYRRPYVLLGFLAVLMGAVAFLTAPFSSFGLDKTFNEMFPAIFVSDLYLDGIVYVFIGGGVFALVTLILAIVDLVKMSRGE